MADLRDSPQPIDDLQVTREALEESRRQLDAIVQSAMDAIITTNEKQRILIFNRAAERMFGVPAEEAVGQPLERFIPARHRATHAEQVRFFGATGGTSRRMGKLGEIRGLRATGEEIPLEAAISQVESGGKKFFTAILRDISERERAEANQRQLAAIVESTESAILSKDLKGVITTWNRGAEALYGYSEKEAVGNQVDLIPPELREEAAEFLREVALGKVAQRHKTVRVRKDGSRIFVSLSLSPVRDGSGAIIGASSIAHDITAQKLAEDEAEEYTRELKRSNEELEQFAYVASHDLQEPLRMVASYTELLAERYRGKLDENADKYIGYAMDGARRMQRMIHDLLAYARVSSQAKPLQPTDASAVLDSVIATMSEAIKNSQAEMICPKLPTVMADEVQLGQVFQNLVGNALKFQSERRPRIEISARESTDWWQFCVADNGIGIEKEGSGRIFQMFQRLHTREEYDGTGIGLAISKRIVERHGGKIWFDSTPGQGTTFYFTLPRAEKGSHERAFSSAAGRG